MKYKIAMFSDTHGIHEDWYELQNISNPDIMSEFISADIMIFAGDMSNIGTYNQCESFFRWYDNIKTSAKKIVIAGNHDFFFDKSIGSFYTRDFNELQRFAKILQIEKLLAKYDNIYYLEDNSVTLHGIKIWGSPWTLPFRNWAFMADENLLKTYIDKIAEDTDILVTHGPAFGRLDKATQQQMSYDGKINLGSTTVRKAIDKIKPKLHISGHIHSNYGMYPTIDIPEETIFVNASSLTEEYEPLNPPIIIEVEI